MEKVEKYIAYFQFSGDDDEHAEEEFDTYEEAKARALEWYRNAEETYKGDPDKSFRDEWFRADVYAGVIGPETNQVEGDIVADNYIDKIER